MDLTKYKELSLIGKGSFGVVKKVLRLSDQKIIAWKQMDYSRMSSRQKQQLVTQVNVLKELSHPNIVKYYDRKVDHKERKLYILMQYCNGGDLASLLKDLKAKKQFLPEDVIWKFIYQIILALDECHNKKILHRDIKPANIFIDQYQNVDSNLKIGDFGLSRQLGQHSQFAQTNVGTPYYMSPQQVKQSSYNQKSDIWSAGCIFYQIASLRRPFQASNQLALAQKICKGKVERIPMKYSEDLQKLIEGMMKKEADRRLGTKQILKLPYLSIRLQQKQVKKNFDKVKIQQNQLEKKKALLIKQIKTLQIQEQSWSIMNKTSDRKKGWSIRQKYQSISNKENFRNFGNITDRI